MIQVDEALITRLSALRADFPKVKAALDRLQDEGWKPTWCGPIQRRLYAWMIFQTDAMVQKTFGLAPELLVLVCNDFVQQRWLSEANRLAPDLQDRFEPNLIVVIDPHPELEGRLLGMAPRICAIPCSPSRKQTLAALIAFHVPRTNHFDVRAPVRGREVVGREPLITALVRDLHDHPAIGLYGLRKMGKTTLALAVEGRLDPSPTRIAPGAPPPPWMVVHVDAQLFEAEGFDPLVDRLITAMGERIGAPRMRPAYQLADLRGAVESTLDRADHLLLVIDELDCFLNPDSAYAPQLTTFLSILRGLLSAHPDTLRLLFIGRHPRRLNAAEIHGRSNPMMSLWLPVWVGPLSRLASGELLNRLGKKSGLKIGHVSRDAAYAYTGGHPLLCRLFGAALWQRMNKLSAHSDPETARPTDSMAQLARQDCQQDPDFETIADEIELLLQTLDPAALQLLKARCAGQPDTIAAPSPSHRLLQDFGLLPLGDEPIAGFLVDAFAPPPARQRVA